MINNKWLAPLIFALLYFFLLVYDAKSVAITDDARFYMEAAEKYSTYLDKGFSDFSYFKKSFIDRYWEENHEHPPFAKLLMASSHLILYKKLHLVPYSVSFRIGISFFAAFMLLFLYDFTRRAFSEKSAIFAALFFILLPRTFFHARVATLDFSVAAAIFIFIYCYWRGFESKFWAWMTGIAFGVALSTKLNAPFMVFPLLIHYVWVKKGDFIEAPFKTIFPAQFLSMLFFSLPIFFAMWPWLWHDTASRFIWYANFHLKHYGILMYYLGAVYREPRPPMHAPMVMALVTTPVITLFSFFISPLIYSWKREREFYSPMLLLLLCSFFALFPVMFLKAPFYSGVKLFQPLFPFMAVMAGAALGKVVENVTIIPKKLAFTVSILFFVPIIFSMSTLKHDYLSYYNEALGGTKGAQKYGFESQYYDLFYKEMADFFNKECKHRCLVSFEPNGWEYKYTADILKESKLLTNSFVFAPNRNYADYFVLTHEYRWPQYPNLLQNNKNLKPYYTMRRQGVSLFTVFKMR